MDGGRLGGIRILWIIAQIKIKCKETFHKNDQVWEPLANQSQAFFPEYFIGWIGGRQEKRRRESGDSSIRLNSPQLVTLSPSE